MRQPINLWATLALLLAGLAGCGSDDPPAPPVPPPDATTAQRISAAAADPANDTSTNVSSAFTVMQGTTVPAVTVKSPPVVNFTVFSDGKVVQGLTHSNVRFAMAKLIPGADGNPDQWVSYVNRTESTAKAPNNVGSGPGGAAVLATAMQANTDANTPAQLVYHPDGYYTYTFTTDVTDPAKTGGVVYEPGRTHRIAIQLSYKNAAGETVLANPYFDFTIGADGNAITVTDAQQTRLMANVANCNGCHEKLALHGGGRVDVQYCVMCHNQGTTDANSGNVLTMSTMTHKIHAGRGLAKSPGGEHYTIWGYQSSKHDYAEVGFPQDLRNCNVCHTNSSPDPAKNTPQGDNWQTKVSKDACLTCHASKTGSSWNTSHTTYFGGADPMTMSNAQCVACHNPATNPALSPGRVHWNQNEENSAKYKMNIESVVFNDTADKKGRSVTVKYFLSDPTQGDAAYNLVTADCTAGPVCANSTKFGNLRLYLAYQNIVGQFDAVTEFSAYNNGGNAANAFAYKGSNDGSNHYTLNIPVPDDTATAIAKGTARVVGTGQVKEVKLQAKSAADPRPPVVPTTLVNVVVQHAYKDVVLSGPLLARRDVVSNEKCNVCHGALGTTSGSNTLAEAFHGGGRNTVQACVLCHDANRFSSTVMTNGLPYSENYSFKRMIHGIHGNSKRVYPFTHGNAVIGIFGKDGILSADGMTSGTLANAPLGTPFQPYATTPALAKGTAFPPTVENYAAEVAYPQLGLNCNACHVNNSYQEDLGTLGAVVKKPLLGAAKPLTADPDPNQWLVISPKAASCTACHDSSASMGHVTSFGGSSFGDKAQGQIALLPRETCNDCHAPGGFKGVDIVHGLK